MTTQSDIASFNRGPLTSAYALPASCTATLTYSSGLGALYYGHWQTPFDTACFPTVTDNGIPLLRGDDAWNQYYCMRAIVVHAEVS
jgi:hypothetical protein